MHPKRTAKLKKRLTSLPTSALEMVSFTFSTAFDTPENKRKLTYSKLSKFGCIKIQSICWRKSQPFTKGQISTLSNSQYLDINSKIAIKELQLNSLPNDKISD